MLLASLVRFQMLCVCIVILLGMGLFKAIILISTVHKQGLYECIKYVGIFGMIGVAALGFQTIDRYIYNQNPEWAEYMEFNSLRNQLYDLGFPNYAENVDVYEKVGISESDMAFFRTWNMDLNVFTIENMQKLVDAKPDLRLDSQMFANFLKIYPLKFFSIALFPFFLMTALMLVIQKRQNWILVSIILGLMMCLNFYLYYINRYGVARVDNPMWASAILALMYYIQPMNKFEVEGYKKWIYGLCGVTILLNSTTFYSNLTTQRVDRKPANDFFRLVEKDSNDLYMFTMGYDGYKLQASYDFFQSAIPGEDNNMYYLGGWMTNSPIMQKLLAQYGVTEPIQDMIDNRHVFYVSNRPGDLLQQYIRENYNSTANLYLVKNIDGQQIYRASSENIFIDTSKCIEADETIQHRIDTSIADGVCTIDGYVYQTGASSFSQNVYVEMKNITTGVTTYQYTLQTDNEECASDEEGAYSKISGTYTVSDEDNYEISIILESGDRMYRVQCE